MKSTIIRRGSQFNIASAQSVEYFDKLPVGSYLVRNGIFGFFLEATDPFTLKHKLYGDIRKNAERFVNTYLQRGKNTGVLLTGEKGCGKSLTAQVTSIVAAERGMPTLMVNEPFCGNQFNELLLQLEQPALILFDEFEKVYSETNDNNPQQQLLSLLDGTVPTNKLFLFTINKVLEIDTNMINRPGRIYYSMKFDGLDTNFIKEYCQDNLNEDQKSKIASICRIATLFYSFNFDSLQAVVEEINRYGEEPSDVLKYLNVKPPFTLHQTFDTNLIIKGKETTIRTPRIRCSPLSEDVRLVLSKSLNGDDDDGAILEFHPRELVVADSENGKYIYVQGDKKLTLTVRENIGLNYEHFMKTGETVAIAGRFKPEGDEEDNF